MNRMNLDFGKSLQVLKAHMNGEESTDIKQQIRMALICLNGRSVWAHSIRQMAEKDVDSAVHEIIRQWNDNPQLTDELIGSKTMALIFKIHPNV